MAMNKSRDHVTFKSSLFRSKQPEANLINSRCVGEDLANWLSEQLRVVEFELGELIQEDWGWGFQATKGESGFWINLGILDGTSDEWLIWIEPRASVLKKLFSKIDLASHRELCRSIDAILQSEPGIQNISWHQMSRTGEEEEHSAHPG